MQASNVRLAVHEDIPSLVSMCKSFHDASPLNNVPFSEEKVTEFLGKILNGPKEKAIILALVDDENYPVGLLIGYAEQLIFSTDYAANELALVDRDWETQ